MASKPISVTMDVDNKDIDEQNEYDFMASILGENIDEERVVDEYNAEWWSWFYTVIIFAIMVLFVCYLLYKIV